MKVKSFKKVFSLLLAVVMAISVFSGLSVCAYAAESKKIVSASYTPKTPGTKTLKWGSEKNGFFYDYEEDGDDVLLYYVYMYPFETNDIIEVTYADNTKKQFYFKEESRFGGTFYAEDGEELGMSIDADVNDWQVGNSYDIGILLYNDEDGDSGKEYFSIKVNIGAYDKSECAHYGMWYDYGNSYREECLACEKTLANIGFTDIADYAENYIEYIAYTSYHNKFIAGTNPPYYTQFSPRTSITRAMLITIIYRMAGAPYDNGEENPFTENPFADVSESSYYYNAACWAKINGITNQYKFRPNDLVTREETASFLYRFADVEKWISDTEKADLKYVDLGEYPDCSNVSSWAMDAMKWANSNGMITGTTQGYLNPKGSTLRIHATKILYGFGMSYEIGTVVYY